MPHLICRILRPSACPVPQRRLPSTSLSEPFCKLQQMCEARPLRALFGKLPVELQPKYGSFAFNSIPYSGSTTLLHFIGEEAGHRLKGPDIVSDREK